LGLLMRRLGESPRASFLAAFLLAASATHFYYSRHLLPYDAALALGLWSLVSGLRQPWRPRDSVLCGLLAAATALSSNGFWALAVLSLVAQAVRTPRTARDAARRLAIAGSAFLVPFAGLVAAGAWSGEDLLRSWLAFSRSVSQGDYAEGWSLP